jgi:predicted DNA-binding helix-hairpin-helix protein
MRYLKERIAEDREYRKGLSGKTYANTFLNYVNDVNAFDIMPKSYDRANKKRTFVPGGQSTQMIIGATLDNDENILTLSEALYKKMNLKRVYYSAYVALNDDKDLPMVGTSPPLLREHRLYQADWLIRYYGFSVSEIMNGSDGNLSREYDPKCDWALRNLSLFPIEINKADYELLLRVPGIGVRSARRIVMARKYRSLDFCDLKKLGIVMKRAQFFITCKGKSFEKLYIEPDFIKRSLLAANGNHLSSGYTKISLFDMVV